MSRTTNDPSQPDLSEKERLIAGLITKDAMEKIFADSDDIVFHDVLIKNRDDLKVTIAYVDGMANSKVIDDNIVYPLTNSLWYENCRSASQAYQLTLNGGINVSSITETKMIKDALGPMFAGKTLLIFDQLECALIADTIGFEKRSISEGTEESTYRSAKESFVEALRVNTSILRRKIKSPYLVLEELTIGKQSNTRVCVAYMQNICNDAFVEKVKSQLDKIDQDKALSVKDIYTNVVQEKYTPFPMAIITEKPDTCCMSLLEGKIAIVTDELPYAMLLPAVFGDFFQTPSDYGQNFIVATLFRLLRMGCFLLSIALPGFYISIVTFHPEMIPYKLAQSIAASRLGTPFSIFFEVLLMTLAFYVLIQASMQISKVIGGAISIVGGLVLGDAAIKAGIVSPAVIVVVASASISSMAIPNKDVNTAIWLFQLICTVFSAILGLVGLIAALLILLFSLAKLESLDVPYLSPYTTGRPLQLGDSFIKAPTNLIKNRPVYLRPKNVRRKK
jgi:spore germination protein KA